MLAIDASCKFGVDTNKAPTTALYSARTERLLSIIATVLPRLPNVEARLSFHGRLLHESFLSTEIGDLSQIKIVRFECYNNYDHFFHGCDFMAILEERASIIKLEVVTTNDPNGSDPIVDNTLLRSIFRMGENFLMYTAGLAMGKTATAKEIALCSKFLTTKYYAAPLFNELYTVAQYTLTLDYEEELENLLAVFWFRGTGIRRLKIISAKKAELDLPNVDRVGLYKLTDLELYNITLSPRLTEWMMLKPGLKITQLVA